MESMLEGMSNSKIQIILGAMIVKIERNVHIYPTIGNHSLYETTNDNGLRLTDFATENGFRIMSTMFFYKYISIGTWRSPDG